MLAAVLAVVLNESLAGAALANVVRTFNDTAVLNVASVVDGDKSVDVAEKLLETC